MVGAETQVSIVVPAFREAGNLKLLAERAFRALDDAGLSGEMIVVDDNSRDGSVELVESLAADYAVRIIVREHERGLSSAVLRGIEEAIGDVIVVMDADLQHPPESIPPLVRAVTHEGADFALGSRYVAGGEMAEAFGAFRRLNSWVATMMARPLTPLRDPMSGFFAFRRSSLDGAAPMNPIGYKIGLEVYVKCRCRNPKEVPISFGAREVGESKLSLKEQLLYVRHLGRLYWFRFWWLIITALILVAGLIVWLVTR